MRSPQVQVAIEDASSIGEARRGAAKLCRDAGFDETASGRVALVVTELATNVVRHARSGELLMQIVAGTDNPSVEVLALDRGPGMSDPDRCLRDGYSTGGTSGSGLGAVRRLADEFDLDSHEGIGTAVFARVCAKPRAPGCARPGLAVGTVCVAMHGEIACGDAWRIAQDERDSSVLIVDGLGHGPQAAEASREATDAFDERPFDAPRELIGHAHRRMSGTRGGAVAHARIDRAAGRLVYAGVGNIAGSLLGAAGGRGLPSHNGTVGAMLHKVSEFEYPWAPDSTLVMHSDGLGSRWQLDRYPGLRARHPAVVAGVLYRDYARGRDDVTVVVAREARE